MRRRFFLKSVLAAPLVAWGCRRRQAAVTVCHAGSLSRLIQEAAALYQPNHLGVEILSEASGSLDAVRKVTEFGGACDIVAVADARLIGRSLIPRFAGTGVEFLGNEIVLAAGRNGFFHQGGGRDRWISEWFELIFSGSYRYGISDPNRDPAGYYSHLVWKLAEIHYDSSGLYRRFLNGLLPSDIRPRSSELTTLLETGHLDLAFLYRSAAMQHSLEHIRLPAEVSLGEAAQAERYARVFMTVAEAKSGSQFEVVGAPIRYGLTRLNGAKPEAQGFVDFLLCAEVSVLARRLGFHPISPAPINPIRHRSAADTGWGGPRQALLGPREREMQVEAL